MNLEEEILYENDTYVIQQTFPVQIHSLTYCFYAIRKDNSKTFYITQEDYDNLIFQDNLKKVLK